MRTKLIALLLIAAAVLSACGTDTSLEGTEWILIEFDHGSLVSGAPVTLNFREGQVSGVAACNHYFGEYSLSSDGSFSTGSMAATEMYCQEEARNQLERDYLEALAGVTSLEVQGDEMVMLGQFGRMVFGLVSNP